jgi:phosphatidyl-myo-inositol dimannoside synthase
VQTRGRPGGASAGREVPLGLIASEVPPLNGGMVELNRCLIEALAELVRLVVVCPPGGSDMPSSVEVHPVLERSLRRDSVSLRRIPVRGWLGTNAGLAPLSLALGAPAFFYCHGNDFLEPWIPYGHRLVEAVRRPYAARLRHAHRQKRVALGLARARHLFTNSRSTKSLLIARMQLPAPSITVCPPGVHHCFFQEPSIQHGAAAGRGESLRLLTVARLSQYTRRKNVDGVIRALALLRDRLPVAYEIVGGGDDLPRLQSLTHELGLSDRVRFLREVDRSELLACYRRADLFVMASKATEKDVEGFGIVYLEANAAGVPVLASVEGGATDAVDDGVSGMLLTTSTPDEIALGVLRFAEQREKFDPRRIVAHAEKFRWPAIAASLLSEVEARL